ncbi:MAG: hypothetical protein RSB16_02940 [Raoultibacter sp.]
MTRKGTQQVAWTTQELAYLLENAGEKSIAEIAAELGRTIASTREQWRRHRAQGSSTRTDKRPACQSCYQRRHFMGKEDICKICTMTAQLEKLENKCSDAISHLTAEDKHKYAQNEVRRGSRTVPMPKAPDTLGMHKKQLKRAEINWEKQCEASKIATLKRKVKASQKRLERIRKKVNK